MGTTGGTTIIIVAVVMIMKRRKRHRGESNIPMHPLKESNASAPLETPEKLESAQIINLENKGRQLDWNIPYSELKIENKIGSGCLISSKCNSNFPKLEE